MVDTSDAELTFSVSSETGPLSVPPSDNGDDDNDSDTDEDEVAKESRKSTHAVISRRILGLLRKVATLAQILETTDYKFSLGLFLTTELSTTFTRERNYVFTSGNIVEMFEAVAKTVITPSKHDLVIVPSTARDLHFNEMSKKRSSTSEKNQSYTPRAVIFRNAYAKFMTTPQFERVIDGLPVDALRENAKSDVSTSVLVLPTPIVAPPVAALQSSDATPFIETLRRKKRLRPVVVGSTPSIIKKTRRGPGRPRNNPINLAKYTITGPDGTSHDTTLIVENDNSRKLHYLIDHMQTNGLEIDVEGIVAAAMDQSPPPRDKHSDALFDMLMNNDESPDVTTSVSARRRFFEELSAEASKLPKSQHMLETIETLNSILALPDDELNSAQVERGIALAIESVTEALRFGQLAIYGGAGFAVPV